MKKKKLLFPWEKKYTIICSICGGKIETPALWFWQKKADARQELQTHFCHTIDSALMEQIPVLSENDLRSKQKWEAFRKEFIDDTGRARTYAELQHLFTFENGLPKIFRRYGILGLVNFFNENELKTLFLLLCMDQQHCLKQIGFRKIMKVSSAHVSTILKKLLKWKLIRQLRPPVKGRAHGRQLAYGLTEEAWKILDEDLREHDFFRIIVMETLRHCTEMNLGSCWRKDLNIPEKSVQ